MLLLLLNIKCVALAASTAYFTTLAECHVHITIDVIGVQSPVYVISCKK